MDERKFIMWDDINFLLYKPDTLEKIIEDGMTLVKEYNSSKMDHQLTSAYSVMYHFHLDTIFMIGILRLIERIGRLEK